VKRQALFAILVIVLTTILLAGCGPKNITLDVEMKEYSFTPDTFSVPAGAEVTLNLSNSGVLEHEYVIMVLGKEATIPFDEDDEANIYWEHELERGESATVTFTAPSEPGVYQIVCGTAGHLEQGMKATLNVTQ
jgi:plastocyanin